MEYVRQYQNRINWENEPSISSPINETNLNKMDKALNYMDGKMLEVVNAIGNDKNVRNAMITSVTQPRTLNAALDDYSGADQLADGDILVVKSTVEGTPTTGWILNIALTGLASVSVNLYSYNSVMFDASIQAGYGLIIKLDMTNSKGYVIGIMNDNGYVRQGKKPGTTVGSYATIEGYQNTASGHSSRAGGQFNTAGYEAQEVIGKYNDNKSNTLFEVGNGTSASAKSNAFEVYNDSKSSWDNGTSKFKFTKNNGIYGYYDESGVFHNIDDTLVGVGKVTSVSNYVVDTDIDLGRAPKVGDRILVLFDSSVSRVDAIKTYNGSTAIQTNWESVPVLDFHLNGVCIIEFITDPLSLDPTAMCARLIRMFEGTVYTAGTGINLSNNKITNTLPQMGVNIDGGTINSVSSGNLGGYAKAAKYLIITFNCDAVPYNGEYHLSLSASGSVAIMYDAVLVDPVIGGRYSRNIKKYTTLICEVTNSGSGSSSDPVLVNVIGEITNDLADKVDAVLDAISEEKSASGNPITVTDALALPAVSLSANITSEQDLHGYDHPWAGGANVQLVDFSNYQTLSNNVSFDYTDGDVTLRSTGTTPNYPLVQYNITSLKGKTLYFADTFTTSDEGLGHIQIIYSVGGQTSYVEVGRNPNPQTGHSIPNNAEWVNLRLYLRNGTSVESGKWVKYEKIMCASSANPTYSPYANECPILGRDRVAVDDTGKNLYNNEVGSSVDSGITYTKNADGIIKATGIASANSYYNMTNVVFPAGTYAFNGCPSGGADNKYKISLFNVTTQQTIGTGDIGSGNTFTANGTDEYRLFIRVNNGYAFPTGGLLFKPMVRLADIADDTYEPYQHLSVTVVFEDEHGDPIIVFGGSLNVTTGALTVKTILVDNGTLTWVEQNTAVSNKKRFYAVLSPSAVEASSDNLTSKSSLFSLLPAAGTYQANKDGYTITSDNRLYIYADAYSSATAAEFKAAMSGVQTEYTLYRPTTIQLTPTQLEMLKGTNRLSSDGGGDLSITYKADRLAAIEAALAQIGA